MSTGIEAWKNLAEIGPLYPFVGTEVMLVIVGVIFWIIWHVVQIGREKGEYNHVKDVFKKQKGK